MASIFDQARNLLTDLQKKANPLVANFNPINIPSNKIGFNTQGFNPTVINPTISRVGQVMQKVQAPIPQVKATTLPAKIYNVQQQVSHPFQQVANFINPLPVAGQLIDKTAQGKLFSGGISAKLGDVVGVASILPQNRAIGKTAGYFKSVAKPEDVRLIQDFASWVEQTGGKGNPLKYGIDLPSVHAMARDVFGDKVTNLNNQKLKNIFDALLQEVGRGKNNLNLGLTTEEVKHGAQQILKSPIKGSKLSTIEQGVSEMSPQLQRPLDTAAIDSTMNQKKLNPFNAQDYITELTNKQQGAGSASGTNTIKQKVGSFLADVKAKMVDETAPLTDVLSSAEKKGQFKTLPSQDIRLQIDRVLRSTNLASQFAEDNGLVNAIKSAPDINALDQYMIAKQAAAVEKNGIKTGRDLVRDKQLIDTLSPEYEALSQQVNQYSRKLLDYSVQSGLIDKGLANELIKKYPEYVPLNRVFNELERGTLHFGTGKGIASLAKQSVVQKLEGSSREIASPIESLLLKTQDAFSQGERNLAAQMLTSYHKLPGNPYNLEPIRTAENVTRRNEILTSLKVLFDDTKKISKYISSENRSIRKINTRLSANGKELGKLLDQAQTMASEFEPSSNINQVLDKVLTRERKIYSLEQILSNGKNAKAKEELIGLLKERKESISSLREELGNVRDITKLPGQQTLSVLRNGIKETWIAPKEIIEAAKSLNVEQMGILGKIISTPTRLLQLGATGLNIPFVVTNMVKDEVTGFINSSKAAQTSMLNPVNYVKSMYAAIGHGELYKDLVRNAGGGTSFDIARSAPNLSIQKLRNPVGYTVRHPLELLRAVENIIGRSEEFGRIKNFSGTRDALLGQGRTLQDANLLGAQAARENTANFARRGSFGRVLNWMIPFFNAGIQGSRQLVRSFQNAPVATSAKVATTVFTPIAVATAWNLSDPQRKQIYQDIPAYEKENNIVIIPPNPTQDAKGRWSVIKIPLPPGLSNLGTIVRRSLEASEGLDPLKFSEVATNLITAGTSIDVTSGNKLASTFTPQLVKPVVEATTNTNLFTGQQIVPDYLKNQPAELQTKPGTSPVANVIGKTLGVSPLLVENTAQTSLGGLGNQLLGKESVVGNLERRFQKASGGNLLDTVYNDSTKVQSIESQARKYVEAGNKEAALQLIRNNKDVLQNGLKAKAIRSQVNTLQEYKNKVRADTRLTQAQKDKVLALIQDRLYKLSTIYTQK